METSLPTPTTARVELLIYQRVSDENMNDKNMAYNSNSNTIVVIVRIIDNNNNQY